VMWILKSSILDVSLSK